MNGTRLRIAIGTALVVFGATAATASAAGPIQHRRENQQHRIAQGVASGRLTAGETARIERREAGLNHEVGAMRRANGGTLTRGERGLIGRQQDRLSHTIFRLKHNRWRR